MKRKPKLYVCCYCGKALTHKEAYTHTVFQCINRPKK